MTDNGETLCGTCGGWYFGFECGCDGLTYNPDDERELMEEH